MTAAVTSPGPLPVNGPVGYDAFTGVSCWSVDGPTYVKSNSSIVTFQPAASSVSTT